LIRIFLLLCCGCVAASEISICVATEQPNVIVIYSDDQGSLDLNCYGSNDLHTPNLDRLADEGIRFTQMYSPSAICSASRAGLLTGRFPARAGVPGNVSSTKGVPGMPSNEITLAELLKSQGYATGHVGKWHLGYTPNTMPNGQGFDSSFGHMGGCIDNYSHFFYWQGPNRHDLWRNGTEIHRDGEFFLDMMVNEGQQFIKTNRDKPFFLYWAINAPHYPMQGTAKWRERYKDLPSPRRQYAAFTSTVDEKVGELIGTLEQMGLRKNTLVIFQSDHGHSTEERAFWGGGNAGPYRGAKGCLFEGGIRIEEAVEGVRGIDRIQSFANEAACTVIMELESSADDSKALNEIKSKIDGISTFPRETEKPIISALAFNGQTILVALSGKTDETTLKKNADQIRDDISALDGISQVAVNYARPYEISIEVSENTLRQYNLSLSSVANAIRTSSLDLPGDRKSTRLHSST